MTHKPLCYRSSNLFLKNFGLALLCLGLAACSKEEQVVTPDPIEVRAVKVTNTDVPVGVEFTGQTKGAIDAEIRSRVEGVVTAIHFTEGKEVTEGQLLYSIDPAPYKAKVAEAQGRLAEAETQLVKSRSDLARVRPLAEMKAVSARDLDRAIAQEGADQASVDAAKASLESAQIELGYCEITSPTTGVIGLTKAKVGEFVGRMPNPVVLNTVSKLDPIHVLFSISEKDYLYFMRLRQRQIEAGEDQKKRPLEMVLADGTVYPLKGEVVSLGREVDPTTGTITLEAAFPNPEKLLRPGQFAKIRAIAETLSAAMVVPKRAVVDVQGLKQLYVVKDDGTVEVRNVKIGVASGELQVIEEGLQIGELVVTDGIQRLRSGVKVSVAKPENQ